MLGDYEGAMDECECTHYGPFTNEEKAREYVGKSHSNPGQSCTYDSGTATPPKQFTDPNKPYRAATTSPRWP